MVIWVVRFQPAQNIWVTSERMDWPSVCELFGTCERSTKRRWSIAREQFIIFQLFAIQLSSATPAHRHRPEKWFVIGHKYTYFISDQRKTERKGKRRNKKRICRWWNSINVGHTWFVRLLTAASYYPTTAVAVASSYTDAHDKLWNVTRGLCCFACSFRPRAARHHRVHIRAHV